MTKIDIISGFLGAGKTTLIKKLISEAYCGEKIVLIENEFGEIGIDGGFMKDAGIEITEMNSGCICCSLVGDFGKALRKVLDEYTPDRIVIEPSGVGKLSDVCRAVKNVESENVKINARTVVADATKAKLYIKNFGEFYNDQIETATAIVLSRTGMIQEDKLNSVLELIREHNDKAIVVTTPWDKVDGKAILEAMEHGDTFAGKLMDEEEICPECGHHHHHHHDHGDDHDECCHHDHDDDDDNDDECCHHDHGEHDHDHDHGECHHHHADEVFTSWGTTTAIKFTADKIRSVLDGFSESHDFGVILRAKGIVEGEDGNWIHFDYVPGESDIRSGSADVTGRLCVIGSDLDEEAIEKAFGVSK